MVDKDSKPIGGIDLPSSYEHLPRTKRTPVLKSAFAKEVYNIAILLAIVFVIRSSIVGLYVIPTGSMLPTINIDDRVIANKLSYGLMLPFMETQIVSWAEPQRGDIVLFKSPRDDNTFVKRVIGVGGDTISFQNGVLHINGTSIVEVEQTDRRPLLNMGSETGDDKVLYIESGPQLPPHYMLRSAVGGPTYFETREWTVPKGKLFVMGDNRDGSNDSRSWGNDEAGDESSKSFIDARNIYGKALIVFYSTVRTEGWLPKFRSERFFMRLN